MNRTWIALLLAAGIVAVGLSCRERSQSSGPASQPAGAGSGASAGSAGSQAGALPVQQELAPSTQPKEYMEPARVFDAMASAGPVAPAKVKAAAGEVDWSRGVIVATGEAKAGGAGAQERLMALRGAEVVAKRNALLIASGVQVEGRRIRGLPSLPAPPAPPVLSAVQIEVQGQLTGSKTIRKDFDPQTRTATATVEAPMYGAQGIVRIEAARPEAASGGAWQWVVRDPAGGESDVIVLDARGLGLTPFLAPRLVDEAGQVVFDPADRGRAPKWQHPFVWATCCAGLLPLDERGLKNPIVLHPARAAGGVIVLSQRDMNELAHHADARELLRAGRAIIVIDPPATSRPD